MVDPEHYAVRYRINPWMRPDLWTPQDADLAKHEWRNLKNVLEELGAEVLVTPGDKDSPDGVFTANHAVVLDGKVIQARFRDAERRGEEHSIRGFFQNHPVFEKFDDFIAFKFPSLVDCNYYFEGAGDAVWDPWRRQFWFGHGPRSDKAVAPHLREFFNVPVTPLELVDPRFYHLDTAFAILPQGEILYYPPAFSEQDRLKIHRLAEETYVLEEADATAFSANAISWNNHVIMSDCSIPLWEVLTDKWGYRIHLVPLRAFHLSGGSAYCLTNRLDNK
jgi:N-dimethylarginine dimethylaminohydrolase